MLIIRNFYLISVQPWTYLGYSRKIEIFQRFSFFHFILSVSFMYINPKVTLSINIKENVYRKCKKTPDLKMDISGNQWSLFL